MSGVIEQPRFSCALAAQQTVLAIPRALPIVHAGPGCSAKVFQFASYGAGYQGEGYGGGWAVSCTNSSEQEVVFGGEDKLRQLITGALQVLKSDMFVVLSGCTAGIVGDDVEQVASEFADADRPVIGAETSGFKGNSYFGHELVVKKIIGRLLDDAEPDIRPGLVNVFSVVPGQNPFWRADLEEIKRLLQAVGLGVNILFGNESAGVSEWRDIPNAQFNLVLSSWVGLETAELLREKYGTPYFHFPYVPMGAAGTSKFLRAIGDFAALPASRVEAVVAGEEKRFYGYFVALADFISESRNNLPFDLYVIADSSYAIGAADYLVNELGFAPQMIYLTDVADTRKHAAIERILLDSSPEFAGRVRFEMDGGKIQADLRARLGNSGQAAILGSTWEDALAAENNNLLVRMSLPINDDVIVTRSFAGYNGGLRLLEEIYAGVFRKGNIAQTTQTQ
ncbi:MAG: hydrogenase [Planctomycetota bacterium]|jgi:nitrogenase molybdenum-iron protein beta chain|nr:hydrogenase [Planctomycetota bacterium]